MKREVLIETNNGEGFECDEYFNFKTKEIKLVYRVEFAEDYGVNIPISKDVIRHIKRSYHPFKVTIRTNAGMEIHSTEMRGDYFEGIKIEKVLYQEVFEF